MIVDIVHHNASPDQATEPSVRRERQFVEDQFQTARKKSFEKDCEGILKRGSSSKNEMVQKLCRPF